MLVEILLKFLVGVIDVELFKPVDLMRDEEAAISQVFLVMSMKVRAGMNSNI